MENKNNYEIGSAYSLTFAKILEWNKPYFEAPNIKKMLDLNWPYSEAYLSV